MEVAPIVEKEVDDFVDENTMEVWIIERKLLPLLKWRKLK
jgi:hypothetical protein